MYLKKMRQASPSRHESEATRYERMRMAIDRIAAKYDPSISLDAEAQTRKRSLDTMAINTLADVERFERDWLELIRDVNGKANKNENKSA